MEGEVIFWIYVASLTLLFIVGSLLLLYLLRRFARSRSYRPAYKQFLLRLFPGVFGGLFVYTLLRLNDLKGTFLENLPSVAFLVMVALFSIVIGFIIFYYVYSSLDT
jgi:H+/Cl- antiporter ClcA